MARDLPVATPTAAASRCTVDAQLRLCRADFKRWFDSHRPSARRYHDAIVAERGFQRIERLAEVQPGDILAVKYLQPSDNTGHVMLVSNPPRTASPPGGLLSAAPSNGKCRSSTVPAPATVHATPGITAGRTAKITMVWDAACCESTAIRKAAWWAFPGAQRKSPSSSLPATNTW